MSLPPVSMEVSTLLPPLFVKTETPLLFDATSQLFQKMNHLLMGLKGPQSGSNLKTLVAKSVDEEESPTHYSQFHFLRSDSNFGQQEVYHEIHMATVLKVCDVVSDFFLGIKFFSTSQPLALKELNASLDEIKEVWFKFKDYYDEENIQEGFDKLIDCCQAFFLKKKHNEQASFYLRSALLVTGISSICAFIFQKKAIAAVIAIASFVLLNRRMKQFLEEGSLHEEKTEEIETQITLLNDCVQQYVSGSCEKIS